MSGVETLNGRFPMMWRFGGSAEPTERVAFSEIPENEANARLAKRSSPTFLPRFRDSSRESSVHPVGEDVAVDNPEPPRRSLGQQLQNRDI